MNEITRIHLGRQAFTISADAHKALQAYLAAIERAVDGDTEEVLREVELRMAELLTERRITGDKVVLASDVKFLKEQLGSPKDFKEGDEEGEDSEKNEQARKHLFRDKKHGLIAGVASGIAAYFNTSPRSVRLLIVVGLMLGSLLMGSFFLSLLFWSALYIAFSLVVPEAKTSSAILQMRGEAVTVKSLKEVVEGMPAPNMAYKWSLALMRIIKACARVLLAAAGVVCIMVGLGTLFGVIAASVYIMLHDGKVVEEGLFPIGAAEVSLLVVGLVVIALVGTLFLGAGVEIVRRKQWFPNWAVAALLGVFVVLLATGTALAADAAPRVKSRYEATQKTVVRTLDSYNAWEAETLHGYSTHSSSDYRMVIRYVGDLDVSKIKTKIVPGAGGGVLSVDKSEVGPKPACTMLCLYPDYNLRIELYGPMF